MQGDQGVPELAAVLNLHPVTVRYHINILLREGLIDQLSYRREGVPGRPEIHYRLRPERLVAGFPPRQYQLLSDILLQLIVGSLDPRRRREALYAAGRRGGEELIQGIERSAQLSVWNPERFVHLFLQGALLEMGLQTELLELREDGVHYRLFTCPFQEIATKYPEEICDHLDQGFHEGIAGRLGPQVVHERLACMGHGDPHCEYVVRWAEVPREEM